jgi:hydroxypyruvate reductase
VRAAAARGLDARAALAANDSHGFFAAAGGLLRPGPTHTNVMDVQIAAARPAGRPGRAPRPAPVSAAPA